MWLFNSVTEKLPWLRLSPLATHLPALVCGAVVGVVLGDVGVDAAERQLLVVGRGDGLDDQLGVGVGRLGVILEKPKAAKHKRLKKNLN